MTYWALAEMVRGRAGIVEGEEPAYALGQAPRRGPGYSTDPEERAWVEPRLAHLLGLEERTARDPEDLFGAWRLFFERLAERDPTIMIFEDMQWADASLLDFVEYLMNWSREPPAVRARPRPAPSSPNATRTGAPASGTSPRCTSSRSPTGDMEALLYGPRPRAARPTSGQRSATGPRACRCTRWRPFGCCSTEGCSSRRAPATGSTGPVEALDVPETLHALIAARLDGLPPEERRLLQDAAILGKLQRQAARAR